MEFNKNSLDAMKEILGETKKRFRRAQAMKLAGYGVAMAGVALGGAWLYGTTDAVNESVVQATKDTLLASGIFAGTGIVAGILASRKSSRVKKCVKQLESALTGYKISRKWGFKPYIERGIKAVTPMNPNQKANADAKLLKNIKGYLDKGILSTVQFESLCNAYPQLKELADSYMPKGNPDPVKPEPVVEEENIEMVQSLADFEVAMDKVVIDDVTGEKIGANAELVLTTLADEERELYRARYATCEGANNAQLAILENAQLLNKDWYPMKFDVVLKDDEDNIVMSDGAVFENATSLVEYYNAAKENIEADTKEEESTIDLTLDCDNNDEEKTEAIDLSLEDEESIEQEHNMSIVR